MARIRRHYNEKFKRGYVSTAATRQVVEALRQAGEHVEAAAKAALKDGAELIVNDAKSRCPVYAGTVLKKANGKTYRYFDKRVTPGQLRDSIHAEANADATRYTISANAAVDTAHGILYYGAIVEFSPKINRPFMYPALDANKEDIYRAIRDAVQRAVERGR